MNSNHIVFCIAGGIHSFGKADEYERASRRYRIARLKLIRKRKQESRDRSEPRLGR